MIDEFDYYITHPLVPLFLMVLLEGGRLMITEAIKMAGFPQGTFYSSKIKEQLIERELIQETVVQEGRTTKKYLELTTKGAKVARRLSLCFDLSIDLVVLPETLRAQLYEKYLAVHFDGSFEEYCVFLLEQSLEE